MEEQQAETLDTLEKQDIIVLPKKKNKITKNDTNIQNNIDIDILNDNYGEEILKTRYCNFRKTYISDEELIHAGLPIRHQNTPEDISENITKFIIRKYI